MNLVSLTRSSLASPLVLNHHFSDALHGIQTHCWQFSFEMTKRIALRLSQVYERVATICVPK
jgi:hypothetical protein